MATRGSSRKTVSTRKRSSPVNGRMQPIGDLAAIADALFRCAVESCRQHHRHARLVEESASEVEQKLAWEVAILCDKLLDQVAADFERVAGTERIEDEDLRRIANMLWHASRDFARRFTHPAKEPKRNNGRNQRTAAFLDLTLQFELDASAALHLTHAVMGYRRLRPQADLVSTPSSLSA